MVDLAAGHNLVQRWRSAETVRPVHSGPAPITTNQRGLLMFERLRPGTTVFTQSFAVRAHGAIDAARLDAALTAVLRRHSALCSTFTDGPDGLVRVVDRTASLAARWTDLSGLPAEDAETTALNQLERSAAEPFDVTGGLLVRAEAVRLPGERTILLLLAHHLVCDGGSMPVLLADLDAAYVGELDGLAPDVSLPPAHPADLAYWQDKLAGVPELDLEGDRIRPPERSFRAGSVPLALPSDIVSAAETLGRAEGATAFPVVLAAVQLLLGEHSGQQDFAVGTPEAGRSQAGRHGVVGLLSDLLVLRTDLTGRPSFRELVRRARHTVLEAFDHRGVPYEDVVTAVAPGRSLDSALVQAGLVYHGHRPRHQLGGLTLEPVQVPRSGLRYDIEVNLWHEQDGMTGSWDYNADIFEPDTAARMSRRLGLLLARALADPDRPVDELDLLADDERTAIEQWGCGPVTDDPDTTLPELFAAQVSRTPDAVAIEDARHALTYRELDERSNRMAHLLATRGVVRGDIVGIRLPRSVDLAVAMLGIQKAGGAYLPLDPAWPAERREYMVQDSGARTVVTQAELDRLDEQPATPVDVVVTPEMLAYVLYTSGSTGRPKGAMLTHRNSIPMVLWGPRVFTPTQMSRMLAATSICFDVSVYEFFAPLCCGGTVVVVDNLLSLLADPPHVTMVCAVPTAAREMVAAGAIPSSATCVLLGGEAVTGTLTADLYATGHVEAVVNMYGPTEDATYSTYSILDPEDTPPPIGRLIPGDRGYVLDGSLRRVPVGTPGELYLAGRGISNGYSGRFGMTASRYVADPFAPVPGQRMYRTGDMVKYRADGQLVFLGRRDFQVKVRGQRVELGEIESTILRHPDVRDAVVAMVDGRLVGYLVGAASGLDLDALRAYLRSELPVALVPHQLMQLPELPRTPSGKVNRIGLPAPDAPTATGCEPPQGAQEELVAAVWQDVLELESVGRDDDFFDLGGDSLLAGQVLTRLRQRAGGGVSLRMVFENTRLADLAAVLPTDGSRTAGPALVAREADAPARLSFEQQRLWLEHQLRPSGAYSVHGRAWLHGELDFDVLERSLQAIVARHELLRTTYPTDSGQPVPRVAPADAPWHVQRAAVAGKDAAAAQRLANAEAATPFDLGTGPLFRCLLIRSGPTEHLLSTTMHHIVGDGHSIGLLVRELSALYRAGGDAARADLPPLSVQYVDYAAWQADALAPEERRNQVAHWRDQLAGAPASLDLPTARRRTAGQGRIGGRVEATVDSPLTAALHALCREHGVTPFMATLAALGTVLHRWSGQDDVVVGVPVHTRRDPATETLIGPFVNTVPVRLRLGGAPTFAELLARVRTASLDSYVRHGTSPVGTMINELIAPRDPARSPVFQVLANMADTTAHDWQLPGIQVTPCELPVQPSQLELDLYVREDKDRLQLELGFQADRYDAPAMQALLDQLVGTIAAATTDPSRGILSHHPEPQFRYPDALDEPRAPLATLERASRDHPERVAVIDRDGSWTYRQFAGVAARAVQAAPGGAEIERIEDLCRLLRAAVGDASVADRANESSDWAVERFDLSGEDRIALVAGDQALLTCAVLTALTAGATTVLAPRGTTGDAEALLAWLQRSAITAVYLTGPVLRALAAQAGGAALMQLRYAFVDNDGDLTGHDIDVMRALAPRCRMIAVYRVAANGTPTAIYAVPQSATAATTPMRVPIGTPLREVEVRNAAGTPTARGEVGILFVGGSPTAERVRRRADDLLEYAGTGVADRTLVVTALRDRPDVHDAIVVDAADGDGSIAYVANPRGAVDVDRLRQHLVAQLPERAMPRTIVTVPVIPPRRDHGYDVTALRGAAGAHLAGERSEADPERTVTTNAGPPANRGGTT